MSFHDDTDDEQDRDAERKREKRAAAKDLKIPRCKNPERRRLAELDSRSWIATYGPEFYRRQLTPQINALIDAYDQILTYGGDQAVAATRGVGKSTIIQWLTASYTLRGLLHCVLIIGQNGDKASQNMHNIKSIFTTSEALKEDYPEVWIPIKDVRGAPQKGMSQTYKREATEIQWSSSQIVLPKIPGFKGSGAVVASMTIESGDIRGFNHEGKRPQIVVLDDPETRESAASEKECENRERIIEADIGGMGTPEHPVARLMLTTIQNRTCLSWRYTDPCEKPSFQGKRFRWLEAWPERKDMWQRYINMRRREMQPAKDDDGNVTPGDRYGRGSHQYYLDNRVEMDAGAVCENPESYDHRILPDGSQKEVSALQRLYNEIADKGESGFRHILTEWQNDPPEDDGKDSSQITPDEVASRLNGIEQGAVPDNYETLVCQIDVHLHWHYWAVMATSCNGTVHDIVDYGLHLVPNADQLGTDNAIYVALEQLTNEIESREWLTTEGRLIQLDHGQIDGGYKQSVVLAFLTANGGIWRMSKGRENGKNVFNSRQKRETGCYVGDHWYDKLQVPEAASNHTKWWLLFGDTDYWMHKTHSLLRATPFLDDRITRRPESMAMFGSDQDFHLTPIDKTVARSAFAVQLCGWVWGAGKPGKYGVQMGWQLNWNQDHWQDVVYGCLIGDKVARAYLPRFRVPKSTPKHPDGPKFTMPDGRPYLLTER